MDFFTSTCSFLDLNPAGMCLTVYKKPRSFTPTERMLADFHINGRRIQAVVDTGLGALGLCPEKYTNKLRLQKEELK